MKHYELFDVTLSVRALGWSMENIADVKQKLMRLLATNTLPVEVFHAHLEQRIPALKHPGTRMRVITHKQLQGGRRFLFQYNYERTL